MSVPFRLVALLASALSAAPALAETVIGVVAPAGGSFALLGKQMLDGASFAAAANGDRIVPVDETCEPGSGAAVAETLIAAKVSVAIGFLCGETLEGAMPALATANIPALTLSVRSSILMEDAGKAGWPLFRMAPSDKAEQDRIVEIIERDWQQFPFALVEDGTIGSRDLTEAVRAILEEKGMKPVFTDTFRPGQEQQVALVRRLSRAGASHVFVGGDRNDVAIMARDAKAERLPLSFMGGDLLDAADKPVRLAEGVQAVAVADAAADPRNADLVKAMRAKGIEPEGYVLPAHAAMTLSALAARDAANEGVPVATELLKKAYDTALGPVRFTAERELSDNPYRLLEWRNNRFMPPREASGE